jgi:nucleotide-binding universal stress UspA family protein
VELVAVRAASASLAVCDAAAEHGADLVVMGTHGRTGAARLLMGSVAEQVIRHAPSSVLTVHPEASPEAFPRRILVTTDFSPLAERALGPGVALADASGAQLTLAHVRDPRGATSPEEEAELARRLRRVYGEHLAGEPSVALLGGKSVAEAIVSHADGGGYDLVVIATHGRTGIHRWLVGSVAEKVARHARAPVMSVRAHA